MIWRAFWRDEAGFVVSSELILIATILVIGLIAGMGTVRDAVMGELADVGASLGDVNQSFSFGGLTGPSSSVSGSVFSDAVDFCELPGNNDRVCSPPLCVRVCLIPDAVSE